MDPRNEHRGCELEDKRLARTTPTWEEMDLHSYFDQTAVLDRDCGEKGSESGARDLSMLNRPWTSPREELTQFSTLGPG